MDDRAPIWIGDEDEMTFARPDFRLGIELDFGGNPTYLVAPAHENGVADFNGEKSVKVTPETFDRLVALKQSAELSGIRSILHEALCQDDLGDSVLGSLRKVADRDR